MWGFFFTSSISIFSLPSSSSFLTWDIFYELFCGKWLKAFANLNGMCMYIFSCTLTFCYRNDVLNSLYRDRLFHCVVHACAQYYTLPVAAVRPADHIFQNETTTKRKERKLVQEYSVDANDVHVSWYLWIYTFWIFFFFLFLGCFGCSEPFLFGNFTM